MYMGRGILKKVGCHKQMQKLGTTLKFLERSISPFSKKNTQNTFAKKGEQKRIFFPNPWSLEYLFLGKKTQEKSAQSVDDLNRSFRRRLSMDPATSIEGMIVVGNFVRAKRQLCVNANCAEGFNIMLWEPEQEVSNHI